MKPWSLQSRLIALVLAPTALLIFSVGVAVVLSRINDLESIQDERARLLLTKYAYAFNQLRSPTTEQLQQLATEALEEPELRSLSLLDAEGQSLLHSGPQSRPLTGSQILRPDASVERYLGDETWLYLQPLARTIPGTGGKPAKAWVMLEFSTKQLTILKYESLLTILLTGLAALGLLGIILTRTLRRWLAPIGEMADTLTRIDSAHLGYRLDTQAKGDLVELQMEINALLDRISSDTEELKSSMVQANEDLHETMEAMEVQNIELTLARKEAVEGNRIKSEFLANISHEIRTPLNGIMGFAKLLQKTQLSPRQLDYVRTIQKSSDSLLAIINDVLDLSKIEAGKLVLDHTPLDIEEVIFDVLNMLAPLAEEKNLEQVAFIYDDVPRHLMGDPLRLKQILTNLVNNAIKFTPSGEVIVRCMLENQTDRHAVIRISVTDTGIGLSDSARADLFRAFSQGDPSTTRQFGGTGLGLVISRHLIEQMHGEINFESTPGEGSTFWFTIKAQLDSFAQSALTGDSLKDCKIVVAEPHEVSRYFLINTLDHWGAQSEGVSSLKGLTERLNSAESPDALILSISLLSSDVREASRLLDELRLLMQGPILLLARSSDSSQEQAIYQASRISLLTKPVAPRELHAQLSSMLSAMPAQMALLPAAHPPAPLKTHMRVLAVDDNPANLKLVCALLEDLQVDAVPASDGYQAIRLCKESAFDLVFMDIQMPGLNGLEATQAIRQHEKETGNAKRLPVIALTAHAMANEREALLKSGMDDYLTKPVQESQLAHMISKWTGVQPGQSVVPVPDLTPDPAPDRLNDCVVDWEESLRLAAGKPDLARDMLMMLLNNLEQDKTRILDACENNRMEALLGYVHYLHGATRYCGVPELRNAAHELETHIKTLLQEGQSSRTSNDTDTTHCRSDIDRLVRCIDELISWRESNELPA